MKITLEYLKNIIIEALEEVSHDTASDGIESMQHDLEETDKLKKKRKKKLRTNKNKK